MQVDREEGIIYMFNIITVSHLGWRCPLPINVDSSEIAAKVSVDDSIDIHHWDDSEYVALSEVDGFVRAREKVVDHPFHLEATNRFARMLSSDDPNDFLLRVPHLLSICLACFFAFLSDCHDRHSIVADAVT